MHLAEDVPDFFEGPGSDHHPFPAGENERGTPGASETDSNSGEQLGFVLRELKERLLHGLVNVELSAIVRCDHDVEDSEPINSDRSGPRSLGRSFEQGASRLSDGL
jgi:hypothetical protein